MPMSVLGIIAEYNPFHNGHLYHINASKSAASAMYVVNIISGCFTQRGDAAICDKFTRARMALQNGADIVVELPVYYAVTSAEYFASAAVKLLNAMGIVTHLSFGSESGDLNQIRLAADTLNKHGGEITGLHRKFMSEGLPYFTARERALTSILHISRNFIKQPNHILAIEYMKTLDQIQSPIIPLTIKRIGSGYHESASLLRGYIKTGDYPSLAYDVPENVFFSILKHLSLYGAADIGLLDSVLFYLLQTKPLCEIKAVLDMNDGVAERMVKFCGCSSSTELLNAVKTKRYAYSRLRRAATHLLLDIRREAFDMFNQAGGPRYIRVLGFRKDAAHLLGEMARRASLPVITDLAKAGRMLDEAGLFMLNKDIQATDLYYLSCPHKKNTHGRNHEYYRKIIVI